MKVGILTYHDGPNHGAFLQAWSTLRVLLKAGHAAEIINYKNPRHERMESVASMCCRRNPVAAWEAWRKHRAFRRAHRAFRMGQRVRTAAEINARALDAIVVGSDVVWNYEIFGYDPVFFGRVDVPRRVAYAASFGAVARGAEHPAAMRDDLARFDAIAVRDENSRAIVASQTGRDPAVTVDPTLLYDFTEEADREPPRFSGHGVVYSYRHPQAAIDQFRDWAREQRTGMVCVGYPPPFRMRGAYDRIDSAVGPFEWLRVMKEALAVMTSTFHGVVFALKYRKEFLYVTNDKAHNRVASLLTACNIPHDLALGRENRLQWFRPNYTHVHHHINALSSQSRQWLLGAMHE